MYRRPLNYKILYDWQWKDNRDIDKDIYSIQGIIDVSGL